MSDSPSSTHRTVSFAAGSDFGALLVQRSGSLNAYARRLTGVAADADDLLQDTMLRCWTARASFQPDTNFDGWTRTVMRNSFLTARRRARFQVEMPEGALDRAFSVEGGQSAAVELSDARWALSRLAPEQRDAVLLASEGVSVDEGAARLGIPRGTFASRIARGRHRLRELTEGGDASSVYDSPPPSDAPVSKTRRKRDWTGVVIG